jgi:hypothetical protein
VAFFDEPSEAIAGAIALAWLSPHSRLLVVAGKGRLATRTDLATVQNDVSVLELPVHEFLL